MENVKCHQKFNMCFRTDRFQSPSLSVIISPRHGESDPYQDWFGLASDTTCVEIDFTWSFSSPATDTPLLKELSNELDSVVDWHSLGVKLGMKPHELGTIEKNYHGDSVRCKHEVLVCFLRSAKLPTWKAVTDALCLMGEHTVALKIRTKHCSSSPSTGKCLLFVSLHAQLGSQIVPNVFL